MSRRQYLTRDGVRLSWVDFGGDGDILACLHGRSGCARNFAPLARALAPDWRVIALDQRGHGWSDHSDDGSRAAFVADAAAFVENLQAGPVRLLGHSQPEESWPPRWETLDEFLAFMRRTPIGMNRLLLDNLVEYEDGWGFRFTDENYRPVRDALTGDWSDDWAAIQCPILLMHGTASWAVTRAEIDRMAALNPRTEVKIFDGAGHVPHDERPAEVVAVLRDFLARQAA